MEDDEVFRCESCGFLCMHLHNCKEAPHHMFDMYDGIIYCNDCAKERNLTND